MSLLDRMKDLIAKWEPHRDGLLKAIAATYGTHTEDDVLAMILAGKLHLTVSEQSAIVTEVCQYPQMRVLQAFLCSGKLPDILAHEVMLMAEARDRGCARVTFGGLPKWEATMCNQLPSPWKTGGLFMYKDI